MDVRALGRPSSPEGQLSRLPAIRGEAEAPALVGGSADGPEQLQHARHAVECPVVFRKSYTTRMSAVTARSRHRTISVNAPQLHEPISPLAINAAD